MTNAKGRHQASEMFKCLQEFLFWWAPLNKLRNTSGWLPSPHEICFPLIPKCFKIKPFAHHWGWSLRQCGTKRLGGEGGSSSESHSCLSSEWGGVQSNRCKGPKATKLKANSRENCMCVSTCPRHVQTPLCECLSASVASCNYIHTQSVHCAPLVWNRNDLLSAPGSTCLSSEVLNSLFQFEFFPRGGWPPRVQWASTTSGWGDGVVSPPCQVCHLLFLLNAPRRSLQASWLTVGELQRRSNKWGSDCEGGAGERGGKTLAFAENSSGSSGRWKYNVSRMVTTYVVAREQGVRHISCGHLSIRCQNMSKSN